MPRSQNIPMRPLPPYSPTKAGVSADHPIHEVPQKADAPILCTICRKEKAVVGGLCIGCDHLMGDIQIDQGLINQ